MVCRPMNTMEATVKSHIDALVDRASDIAGESGLPGIF